MQDAPDRSTILTALAAASAMLTPYGCLESMYITSISINQSTTKFAGSMPLMPGWSRDDAASFVFVGLLLRSKPVSRRDYRRPQQDLRRAEMVHFDGAAPGHVYAAVHCVP